MYYWIMLFNGLLLQLLHGCSSPEQDPFLFPSHVFLAECFLQKIGAGPHRCSQMNMSQCEGGVGGLGMHTDLSVLFDQVINQNFWQMPLEQAEHIKLREFADLQLLVSHCVHQGLGKCDWFVTRHM